MTARLSRKFYETLGEEIATELVDWLNAVDATHRSDMRELADAYLARSDARIEQRLAEAKSDLRTEIAGLRVEMHEGFASLRTEMHGGLGSLRAEMIKWMFVFWVGTVVTSIGLVFSVVGLLR